MCVSTAIRELWAIFVHFFLAAEMAFVCLVREYQKEDSSSNSFIIVSPVQVDLFEEKERGWETEKEREGRRGEKEGKKVQDFFCLKESISGLSMSSLVLSCTDDTPKQSYLFQFQNCQIYIPLVQKAFELDKNYSCEWSFTLSIVISFLFLRILEL